MTMEGLPGLVVDYLWQVALHSFVAGFVMLAWTRHLELPPGAARRRVLSVVLVLPLLTAAVPGRFGPLFGETTAWFDSGRLLTIGLFDGVRVGHVAAGIGALTLVVSLWQEVIPSLRRSEPASRPLPEEIRRRVRSLADWSGPVELISDSDIMAAVADGAGPPRLLLSEFLADNLDDASLDAVVRHEMAHQGRRLWVDQRLLFLARLLQLHNPVALWAFREYCVEVEMACDREAIAGGDSEPLTRALLLVYEDTDERDLAGRSVLRQRIDVLLGRVKADGDLPVGSLVLATATLAVLLPWIV
jgi:hypothetical protein